VNTTTSSDKPEARPSLSPPEDRDPAPLLPRVAAGEPGALSELLDRSAALMQGIVRRYLGEAADIEDALQDIAVSIWKSAHRFDARQGRESTFLATITRRRMIDRLRQQSRRPETVDLGGVEEPDVEGAFDAVDAEDEVRRVERAIGELSTVRRRVLGMALKGGWTHVQIADRTGLPLGTVKSHVRRATAAVRARLAVA